MGVGPNMEYVLPEPVCPYAKMVPLKPCTTSSTVSWAILSNTYACEALGPKTWSNVYVRSVVVPADRVCVSDMVRSSSAN